MYDLNKQLSLFKDCIQSGLWGYERIQNELKITKRTAHIPPNPPPPLILRSVCGWSKMVNLY